MTKIQSVYPKQLSSAQVAELLQPMALLNQEHFVCLTLDSTGQVITRRTVFIGTLDSVQVHPREIFAGAITDHAAAIVVAHNHPSGEIEPSKGDIATTQRLASAGQLLGIPLRDHLILAKNGHYSFRGHGLLWSLLLPGG